MERCQWLGGSWRRKSLCWDWQVVAIAIATTGFMIGLTATGLLQRLELAILDQFFLLRPSEPCDARIVVITIDDADIAKVGRWPIPDQVLANVLLKLEAQKPRVIGLNLYRDLPVEPGHEKLNQIFQAVPHLIGVQKRFGRYKIPPAPVLKQQDRFAFSDIGVDLDGKVRRGLLSVLEPGEALELSLGTRLALEYLKADDITPEQKDNRVHLGRARFMPFRGNEGGYVGADDYGFRILLNFRGPLNNIQQISLTDVLKAPLPPDLVRDRIVLIGSMAESFNEFFGTPYSADHASGISGVFIHAAVSSQILSSALDGRPTILTLPKPLEWLWILAWSSLGVWTSWQMRRSPKWNRAFSYGRLALGFFLVVPSLPGISYLLFAISAWWIPVVVPLLGFLIAGLLTNLIQSHRLQQLAYFDSLTRLANRRYFDHQLVEDIAHSTSMSLILCDVDCFKLYNDTYGHQAGDLCLQQIAHAISAVVRQTDLVARYGGEEFAIILPNSSPELAVQVGERVLDQVRNLRLPHRSSLACEYVTLSCGVANMRLSSHSVGKTIWSPSDLILRADQALYVSKTRGRDRLTPAWELPLEI